MAQRNNMGMIDFSTLGSSPDPEEIALKSEGQTIICFEHGWLTAFMSLNKSNFVILKPGNYYINLVDGDTTTSCFPLNITDRYRPVSL